MTLEQKYKLLLNFCVDMAWTCMRQEDINALLSKNNNDKIYYQARIANLARINLKEIGELD